MLYRFLRRNNVLQQYTDGMYPILIESVAISIMVNLLSDYLVKIVPLNRVTVFMILFFLVVTIIFYSFGRGQIRDQDVSFQRNAEFGSFLSLSFFIQLTFLDCTTINSISRWILIGVGVYPLLNGFVFSDGLERNWRKHVKPFNRRVADDGLSSEQQSQPVQRPKTNEDHYSRISIRNVINGTSNVDQQPSIIIVVIETILSIKEFVTQSEIIRALYRISRGNLAANIIDTIHRMMALYVIEHQQRKNVNLHTEHQENWAITGYGDVSVENPFFD